MLSYKMDNGGKVNKSGRRDADRTYRFYKHELLLFFSVNIKNLALVFDNSQGFD